MKVFLPYSLMSVVFTLIAAQGFFLAYEHSDSPWSIIVFACAALFSFLAIGVILDERDQHYKSLVPTPDQEKSE